jgi:hypothetical protein
MTDSFWGHSECIDSWLHRFNIVEAYENGIKERCEICGEEIFNLVVDGRVDNIEYLSYHARQALMPQHELFNREYAKL